MGTAQLKNYGDEAQLHTLLDVDHSLRAQRAAPRSANSAFQEWAGVDIVCVDFEGTISLVECTSGNSMINVERLSADIVGHVVRT